MLGSILSNIWLLKKGTDRKEDRKMKKAGKEKNKL
jgi:hypothetical protein